MWELSNGVLVLSIAGGCWFGLAGSSLRPSPLFGLIIVIEAALIFGAVWLRRKATGFRLAEVRQLKSFRDMLASYVYVNLGQAVAIAISVGVCFALGRTEFVWPAIALIVSIHFGFLAYVFRTPLYYAPAALGAIISVIAVLNFHGPSRIVFLGAASGTVVWLTALYIIVRAEALTARAMRVLRDELPAEHVA